MGEKGNKALTGRKDKRVAIGFMVFSVILFVGSYTYNAPDLPNTVNSTFFPRIVSCLLMVCAILLYLQGQKEIRTASEEERTEAEAKLKEKTSGKGLLRCALLFLDLLAAAIALQPLGFIITLPPVMFVMFMLVESREKWNLKLYALLSIVCPIAVFFIFYYAFSQLLPMGILKSFLTTFL